MPLLTPARVETHELLDEHDAPREDMERSLRDLRFINRYLGGVPIYRSLVRRFEPRSVLDLGTGTSDLLESIPGVPLRIGLDFKLDHLTAIATDSRIVKIVADAARLPFRDDAVDVVTSAHFFHHFSPAENESLLRESLRVARKGVAVNDTRRNLIPLLFVSILGLLRLVGRITRFDAPASVRQGYTVREARAIAAKTAAARWEVIRKWPFRLAILLWK
jgi:SAM-dependent methyltransferase